MITADHVARAIIAACRETGADPIAVASGEPDARVGDDNAVKHANSRARAYAGIALRSTFPDHSPSHIALMIGVSRVSSQAFFSMLHQRRHIKKKMLWWRDGVLQIVKEAITGAATKPEPAVVSSTKPRPISRPSPTIHETVSADDDDGPVFDAGRISPEIGRRPAAAPALGKRALLDELRQAAINTAKMTPPGDD